MINAKKQRRRIPTGAAPDIDAEARQAFLNNAQVKTATPAPAPVVEKPKAKTQAMKARIFRFGQDDDERLASLVRRMDVAQVRPIPSGAEVVRAGLRALEKMNDRDLMELLSE